MHFIGWEKVMPVQTAQRISVRQIKAEDRPQLEEMYHTYVPLGGALGLPPPDLIVRRRWLDDLGRGINLVAYVDDKLAGHLVLLPTGGAVEMVVYVHQDFRLKGVATALVRAAIEEAHTDKFSYIWLLVAKLNFAAQRFLQKLGFRIAWEDLHEAQFLYPTTGM